MDFIPVSEVPKFKKVAYVNMVCDRIRLKTEKHIVRFTIGGGVLDDFGDKFSPAASLLETSLLINSALSDTHHGARFMSLDIKDHFIQSISDGPEYV